VLLKDVSGLQAEVTDLKLAQKDKLEEIRNRIRHDTKEEIANMLKCVLIAHHRIHPVSDISVPVTQGGY